MGALPEALAQLCVHKGTRQLIDRRSRVGIPTQGFVPLTPGHRNHTHPGLHPPDQRTAALRLRRMQPCLKVARRLSRSYSVGFALSDWHPLHDDCRPFEADEVD
jgi:hypothetical protein